MTKRNPLLALQDYGQSIWLDFLRRGIIESGELEHLIAQEGLRGVTSNPTIFEKAIGGSNDYVQAIQDLALQHKSADQVLEELVVEDIQRAASLFQAVYDRLDGGDGFVSLEVSPHLARDTEATIREARRLWALVNRENVLIKVPGTQEGLPAIRQLISEGINVNVTLLFGLARYRQVADAYMSGLEDRLEMEKPLAGVASVASFFLSRIDVLVDPMLRSAMNGESIEAELARTMHGQVAISSAKVAYQIYRDLFHSRRFRELARQGARVQRLLWASTSTKNPDYGDIKYVEDLIGPDTINTVPLKTLNAYRNHGDPQPRLERDIDTAQRILEDLPLLSIDLDQVTQQLEEEGIEKFNRSFDKLVQTLEQARRAILAQAEPAF